MQILISGRVELTRSMEIAASAPLKRQPGEERGEGPAPAIDEAEAPSATSEAEAKLQVTASALLLQCITHCHPAKCPPLRMARVLALTRRLSLRMPRAAGVSAGVLCGGR